MLRKEVTGMKAGYRSRWIGLFLAAVFCFSPVVALAAESSVHITSGLNLESDETECTFEESRIIYGEAAPGTEITFTVSRLDRFGETVVTHTETLKVGSMGLFSATLPLGRGNNDIAMTVTGEDSTTEVTIKQVPQAVKNRLQQMIALPGMQR